MFRRDIRSILNRYKEGLQTDYREYYKKLSDIIDTDCLVGVMGLQSIGKTTLLNSCIGYPVLPSMQTRGTSCPVRIQYGKKPSMVVHIRKNGMEKIVSVTPAHKDIFSKLKDYVCTLMRSNIGILENLGYFTDKSYLEKLFAEDLHMDPDDIRHFMILALILLNVHVDLDADRSGQNSGGWKLVVKQRQELLKDLGLEDAEICLVQMTWNSALLRNGIQLLDLPGMGSNLKAEPCESGFTDDAFVQYAKMCDILLCITSGEAVGGRMKETISRILGRNSSKRNPVVMMVVNKADIIANFAVTFNAAMGIVDGRTVPCCFLSALSGEFRYLGQGICLKNTFFWKYQYLPMSQDMTVFLGMETVESKKNALNLLRKAYIKKYPYYHQLEEKSEISLKIFIESILLEQCCKWFFVCVAHTGKQNLSAFQFLKHMVKNTIMFLTNKENLFFVVQRCIIVYVREKISELMEIYQEAETSMQFAIETFFGRKCLFVSQWNESVCQMNAEIYGILEKLLNNLTDIFGYILFAYQPSNFGLLRKTAEKNQMVVTDAIDRIKHYNISHTFMKPVETYEEAFNYATNVYKYCLSLIEAGEKEFQISIEQLYMEIINRIKKEGYDEDNIAHYYKNLIYKIRLMCRGGYEKFYQIMPMIPELPKLPMHKLKDEVCEQLKSVIPQLCQNRRKIDSSQENNDNNNKIMIIRKRNLKEILSSCLSDEKEAVSVIDILFSSEQEGSILHCLESSMYLCRSGIQNLKHKLNDYEQSIPAICKTFQDSCRDRMEGDLRMLTSFLKYINL